MVVEGGSFMEIWRETRASLVSIDADIDRIEGEYAVAVSKPTPSGRQATLRAIRQQMAQAKGVELYRLRAAFAAGLRDIADMMIFSSDGSVILIILASLKNYRFDDQGVHLINLTSRLPPEVVEANHTFGHPDRQRKLKRITA
jgi:hypothetical protein